jgi:tetratricopeptide (TPR) repeat protein
MGGVIHTTFRATLLAISSVLFVQYGFAATTASEYRQLGLAYRQQERFPEAIAALQKSVELDPQNLDGRVLLGWTLHRGGEQTAAAQMLQQTVLLNPFYVPTLNALGIVYLVDGKLPVAVLTHTWAALLKPNNEIAYYNLSLAFHRLQQYETAIANAMKAAELEPDNPHPLVALAIAQWDRGDRAAAEETYRRAISLDPRYADSSFLNYLNEAGFSIDQIQQVKKVLNDTV